MKACQACGQLHELVPVVRSLLAATPILLEVMEDCISRMECASCLSVFLRDERTLFATLVGTYILSILCHLQNGLKAERLTTGFLGAEASAAFLASSAFCFSSCSLLKSAAVLREAMRSFSTAFVALATVLDCQNSVASYFSSV